MIRKRDLLQQGVAAWGERFDRGSYCAASLFAASHARVLSLLSVSDMAVSRAPHTL